LACGEFAAKGMLYVTGYGVEVVAEEIIAESAQETPKTLPMMML